MNKYKHTLGPWELAESNSSIPVKGSNGKTVCNVRFRENDLYDARLIAAAPDLLEALEMVLNQRYAEPGSKFNWSKWAESARRAIARTKV